MDSETPKFVFASEPMLVGKHLWRIVVEPSRWAKFTGVANCSDHQWKRASDPHGVWRNAKEWPAYDGDDTYDGLPKGLQKLWEREYPNIYHLLGRPAPKTPRTEQELLPI